VTTSPDIPGYIGRLGLPIGSPASWPAPDLATLRDLVARHVLRVPFENASVLRGEPIVLDPAALVGRLVGTRRGGFCYQLNGAFSSLLVALGYEVELLAARFHSEPAMEPRFGHLAMRVSLDDVPWLVDVGGGLSFRQPLRIETGVEQDDPAGCFRLVAARDPDQEEGERPIDVEWRHRDGVFRPHYRFEAEARQLDEFESTCEWTRTSAASPFTSGWICAVATPAGWATLDGRRFRLTGADDLPDQDRELSDDADLEATLDRWFGISPS
jgi:N-hydroxyarylamine O-acetyltransferase